MKTHLEVSLTGMKIIAPNISERLLLLQGQEAYPANVYPRLRPALSKVYIVYEQSYLLSVLSRMAIQAIFLSGIPGA